MANGDYLDNADGYRHAELEPGTALHCNIG